MCLGKEEGQCVLEWCASCNFDTTRTALVREMCDCIDDLKYADDEDVDEMIVEWKPLAAQSFKKKLALLKSGFSGEGAAALNQPGAFASGFSAAAAAAPPSPRQGSAKARQRRRRRGGRAEAAPSRPARARRRRPGDAGAERRRGALLDRDARIAVAQPNPKAPGTLSFARYEAYAAAATCSEFLDLGGRRDDLKHDLAKGFVVVVGPGHGRSRVSSDVADDTDDDDGVIDLGPPAEDKALDAEVAGLLAGGDGDDDALLTISL
ncbi:hypothetical protein JL722_11685 [Aureococcus anophagefferens]|nr:hypothetical protein JL722_11685 [Aureococcus anophagefferens]